MLKYAAEATLTPGPVQFNPNLDWEDIEFTNAVKATSRKKLVMRALWNGSFGLAQSRQLRAVDL